jgi:predicted ATPase
MEGARFIERLRLKNLLSFGGEGVDLALEPLNVLIGPNGSGKSNLIEALGLLQAAPSDLTVPLRHGGGAAEWFWKGNADVSPATLRALVGFPAGGRSLDYHLSFALAGARPVIVDESVEDAGGRVGTENGHPYSFYQYRQGRPLVNTRKDYRGSIAERKGRVQEDWAASGAQIDPGQSILSQAISSQAYPELTFLGQQFRAIQFYREFDLSRNGPLRRPQPTELPGDHLQEDGGNLWLVINALEFNGQKPRLLELLRRFYEPAIDFTLAVQGGTIQLYLREEGLVGAVPASRLSDGTLRYLCLLAVLLDPAPPPLVCIEEPEAGLHPDILPTIAELLVEASQRTQLIVATHSDRLISALGVSPEVVVVCERDDQGTRLERLEREPLREWLAKYSLGMLWSMGEIGGNRW